MSELERNRILFEIRKLTAELKELENKAKPIQERISDLEIQLLLAHIEK